MVQELPIKQQRSTVTLKREQNFLLLPLLAFLVLLALILGLSVGSVLLNQWGIIQDLFTGKSFVPPSVDLNHHYIIWDIRLPRVLLALLSGMGLGIAGASMQGILRNPLASPYTLGISSAAGFGASLSILLKNFVQTNLALEYHIFMIFCSFFFALGALAIVLVMSRKKGFKPSIMILSGISMMYLFSAGTSLIQFMASNDQLAQIVFWLMGSLMSADWTKVSLLSAVLLLVTPFLIKMSWSYNLLSSGEEVAQTLGINPGRVMIITALLSAFLTATIISFCGVIGFIGLVAPHMIRLLMGGDYRLIIPGSALGGALILSLSDTLSRSLFAPMELPIGVVTAFIGVPFFISLLMQRRMS
ncbi:FecCD family ABC transporter permease [Spirochaeta cellobiosiphila]|uniref:FecCD family ABC transporter permease n=1 Tax=Spirochaeta cellobiosiphila TaxID=504483 RepID=UPI00041D1DEA|nr:iron ABC transporter permease [Spirochaeta cellobiosiphila]